MSCFGLRPPRAAANPASSRTTDYPHLRHFRRTITSTTNSSPDPASATRLPDEDLSATKRRLVIIRRQPQYTPFQLSVGFKSRTGWQALSASRDNQDSLAVVLPLADPLQTFSLFAVFDGHGRAGHRVSAFVAENLANAITNTLLADKTLPASDALRLALQRTDTALRTHSTLDVAMTGTTAAVALVHGRFLTVANIGDSRIVLGTVREGAVTALPVTTDHVPHDRSERIRIEKAGGRVEAWTPVGLDTGPPRVWLKDRRLPGLSMSRVMGDTILEGIVSADPEIETYPLTEDDLFVVVATDGLWGQMSNEDVVEFIAQRPQVSCQRVTELLVRHVASLWFESGGETIDDISVIVIRLDR